MANWSINLGRNESEDAKFVGGKSINWYMDSSTETVAFKVYEILKTDHEFLQFFWLGSKI